MNELNWQDGSAVQSQLSSLEKKWLFDRGSLTKRLILLSWDNFSLSVVSEKDQNLRNDECVALNLVFPRREWVREVFLRGCGQSWVYARSVLVIDCFQQQDGQALRHMGKQPLGSVLFRGKDFQRDFLEIGIYPRQLLPASCSCPDSCSGLWARRSVFSGNRQRLLVQEVFLPGFWSRAAEYDYDIDE